MSSPFPALSREDVIAFQFSTWFPMFSSLSIKSTVIPLADEFRSYLEADGVLVPKGSENLLQKSTFEDDSGDSEDGTEGDAVTEYAFPELDAHIRAVIDEYGGAVFPKLNFSSPKDAAWLLPSSSPLRCTSPADVYVLLKSSDFVLHDLDAESVFDGCVDNPKDGKDDAEVAADVDADADVNVEGGSGCAQGGTSGGAYRLELVLRKWFAIDPSREMRAFVRDGVLVGISQRDVNYYDFLNEPETQSKIVSCFEAYWAAHVKPNWTGPTSYTLDALLTRDLTRFHVIDFNPYAPRTDALLFTYDELATLFDIATTHIPVSASSSPPPPIPTLRVIDSRAHPAAARNAPQHQHNMVPLEALTLSEGRSVEEFAAAWMEQVRRGTTELDDGDDGEG